MSVTSICDVRHIPNEHLAVSVLVSGLFIPDSGGGKMCSAISSRPKLDDLKKKQDSCFMPYTGGPPPDLDVIIPSTNLAGLAQPRLDDAQYVVAREHGYGSWQKLKEHLHTTKTVSGTARNPEGDTYE
jgi:hypothetical protein